MEGHTSTDDTWTLVTRKFKHCSSVQPSIIPPVPHHVEPNVIMTKADSAASGHYFAQNDAVATLHNLRFDPLGPTVVLPNKSNLTSSQAGNLPIPNLSHTATKTSVFHNLNNSLISLGQLCDVRIAHPCHRVLTSVRNAYCVW